MIKETILEIQQNAFPKINGNESLSVADNFRFFFKELSVGFDKKVAGLSHSAHVVDVKPLVNAIPSINYFRHELDLIPVPAFFDPNKMNWETYCANVNTAPFLISTLSTEASRFYDWLKEIASRGVVARSFSYTIASTDESVAKATAFIKSLSETKNSKVRLNQVYESPGQAVDLIGQFNSTVMMLKPRDIEVTTKQLDLVYKIGELLADKIKSGDIVLNADSLETIQKRIDSFVNLVNITGAMSGMLNELTAVFKEQVDHLKAMK